MTSLAWGQVKPERLLATIVLLQLLNDTPQLPSENVISDVTIPNESPSRRVLELGREKELAEVLAFLAASTDNPAKVVALCIEEQPNRKSMIVRMAVNNRGLQKVKRGFQEIAEFLEKVAKQGSSIPKDDEASLLRKVVSLHHNRILCRLRSKHATLKCNFKQQKQLRPKVIPLLHDALASISDSGISPISSAALTDLQSDVRTLQTLFSGLEAISKHQALSKSGLDLLIEIVVVAQRLHSRNLLDLLLGSSALEPSARINITRTIMKLGRYNIASSFLIHTAKELSIFANITISVVKLPASPVISLIEPQNLTVDMIYSLFDAAEVQNTASHVQNRFERKGINVPGIKSRLSNILSTKFVVHAEIQLLIYYEMHNVTYPPRVLCSTKKACFLCSLFIRLHGKFKVPSTHGRLYEKWTFPEAMKEIPEIRARQLGAIVDKFSDALEDELRREILDARKPYPAPFESTVFASAVWAPLTQSRSLLESASAIDCDHPRPVLEHTSNQFTFDLKGKPAHSSMSVSSKLSSTHARRRSTPVVDKITPSSSSSTIISPVYLPLTQGESLLQEISPNDGLLKVGTPRIHLTLSYERWKESQSQLQDSQNAPICGRLWVKVKWLRMGEFPKPSRQLIVVDLEKFGMGSQETLDQFAGNCEFFIRRRLDVISIQTSNNPFL